MNAKQTTLMIIIGLFLVISVVHADNGNFSVTQYHGTDYIYRTYNTNKKTMFKFYVTKYLDYNRDNLIVVRYMDFDGKVITNATITMTIDGQSYNMSYNKNIDAYIIYVKPTQLGNYNFLFNATYKDYQPQFRNVTFISKEPFIVDISLYADKDARTLYKDEFGFILLRNKNITCFDNEPCDFFAPYRNGVASIKLYEIGNYDVLFGHGNKQYNNYWEIPQQFFLRDLTNVRITGGQDIKIYVPKYQFGLTDYSAIFDLLNSSLLLKIAVAVIFFFIAFYFTMDLTASIVFSIFIFLLLLIIGVLL